MTTDRIAPVREVNPRKSPILRLRVVLLALALAGVVGWLVLSNLAQSEAEKNPYEMSRADGRPRFVVTKYAKYFVPPDAGVWQRLHMAWINFERRHHMIRTTFSFPATPVRPCSIDGLLAQCMEVTGTRYLIAVEIAGAVEFGNTNTLSGPQWVAAFENALQASKTVMCYDYATKRNFEDNLLLIREKPGLVKVVPLSKLADYQKAGLADAGFKQVK